MSAPTTTPHTTSDSTLLDDQWIEEGPWVTRVAWPQVATLGGISLAVLAPLLAAILLA